MSSRVCCLCDLSVDNWNVAGERYLCERDSLRVKAIVTAYLGIEPCSSDSYGLTLDWRAAMEIIARFEEHPESFMRVLTVTDLDRAEQTFDLYAERRIRELVD